MGMAAALRIDQDTREELESWYRVARNASWRSLDDVRGHFPSADRIGAVLVFNVRHNRYRLIVRHAMPEPWLYIKALLSHKEYERKEWLKWS